MSYVLSALLLICTLWFVARWMPAGSEARMPLPYALALVRFLWIPYAILAVWAAIAGLWWQCIVAVIGVGAVWASQLPYWRHIGAHLTKKQSNRDRYCETESGNDHNQQRETYRETLGLSCNIMTLNCRYGHADPNEIIEAVRDRHISVLALQELSSDLVAELTAQGLDQLLPYCQLGKARETDNGGFNGIWTNVQPVATTHSIVPIPAADVPAVTLAVATTDNLNAVATPRYITFASAHTKSPMRGCREWSAGIIGLGALADGEYHDIESITAHTDGEHPALNDNFQVANSMNKGTTNTVTTNTANTAITAANTATVVLGDLNAGLDHPSFRALLRHGLHDASLSEAHGPNFTFPSWITWPRIELDHALATDEVTFSHIKSFTITNTDHLALIATLSIR